LVHDRPSASRVPYRAQGHAMCPVRWSLKNQRTAQAVPIADILRCVGISVCMIVASWAEQRMFFSRAECPAAMTALAGVRRRHFLNRHTGQVCLVGDEVLQLEERPVVPILSGIRFRSLPLSAPLADTREIFETDAGIAAVRKCHHVFGEAVVDMRHNPPFTAFKLLDGPMLPSYLQLLSTCSIHTAHMTDTCSLPEDDRPIGPRRSERDVLPTVNTKPAACRLSIGKVAPLPAPTQSRRNLQRHRETGIPDTLARTPEFDRTRRRSAIEHCIQPALMRRMMDGQRHTLLRRFPEKLLL
jgi:hypothetical protein